MKKMLLEFQQEFFPNKVTVSRPANNHEFLRTNFFRDKIQVILFDIVRKKKNSEYILLIALEHCR